MYVSTDGADSFTRYQVVSNENDANIIFIAADVDMLGNVYLAWCTQSHIYLGRSMDKGVSWDVFQVTDTQGTKVFPWVVAGDPGRIALTCYDTPDMNGSSDEKTDAVWSVQGAITTESFADNISFLITTIEPDVHTGAIRTTGTGGGALPQDRYRSIGHVRNVTRDLTVRVDASRSYDMSGERIVDYLWDWGDGYNSSGVREEHTYDRSGTYDITLRVMNQLGMIGWATGQVTAKEAEGGGKRHHDNTHTRCSILCRRWRILSMGPDEKERS